MCTFDRRLWCSADWKTRLKRRFAERVRVCTFRPALPAQLDREKRAALAAASSKKQKGVTVTLQEFLEGEGAVGGGTRIHF